MSYIEKSIYINVPVKAAYNQWTQFEKFPRFMEGVKEVQQLDDTHLHWKAEIGGRKSVRRRQGPEGCYAASPPRPALVPCVDQWPVLPRL